MNINEVYQLMDKFERSTLGEISIEMDGVKFAAKKGNSFSANVPVSDMQISETTTGSLHTEMLQETVAEEKGSTQDAANVITAPLVGTFYRAPGPGEAPFVEAGQSVKVGDVVGIIEAMKLMNEITATKDGVVETILVEDGELVEFGKPLIRLV